MNQFRNIVVGVDFSRCSLKALAHVRAVENESGGKPALAAEPIHRVRTFSDMESPV